MPIEKCKKCGRLHYVPGDCPPAHLPTAPKGSVDIDDPAKTGLAPSMAPAAEPKAKRGRPSTGFDKKAHDRQKARERRARLKEQKNG